MTQAAPNFFAARRRDWPFAGVALIAGFCVFLLLFHEEIATAIYVWNNSDAYNHCFLVIPVAAYLAWDRRDVIKGLEIGPQPRIVLVAVPVAIGWFAAERLGVMEGRQLMAVALLQIMVASIIGLRAWRALAAPLLYLFFLVPFGEFLVPSLQRLVVDFTTAGLGLLNIPYFSDGMLIEIPEGTFLVHQACSGLRFLVASLAFGVLYACIMYTSILRRVTFIAFSLALPIIGNCFRVIGTILAAHFIGNAEAVEANHVLWGWLFYLIIGAVLVLIGLRYRQERRPLVQQEMFGQHGSRFASAIAIVVMGLVMISARSAAAYIDDLGTRNSVGNPVELPLLTDCVNIPLATVSNDPAEGAAAYKCNDGLFEVTLRRYPPRINVRQLFLSLQRIETPADADTIFESSDIRIGNGLNEPFWRITEFKVEGKYQAVAIALWLDGRPSRGGIAARLVQALNTMRPRAVSPVGAIVTYSGEGGPADIERSMERFLLKTHPLSDRIMMWLE